MWYVIIMAGVGKTCVEDMPWICFATVINHLWGCFHPLSLYLIRILHLPAFSSSLLSSFSMSCTHSTTSEDSEKKSKQRYIGNLETSSLPWRPKVAVLWIKQLFFFYPGGEVRELSRARAALGTCRCSPWVLGAKYAALTATRCTIITTYNHQGPFGGQRKEGDKRLGKIMNILQKYLSVSALNCYFNMFFLLFLRHRLCVLSHINHYRS